MVVALVDCSGGTIMNTNAKYNKHLTADDRFKLQKIFTDFRQEDGSLSKKLVEIANMLEKDPTTISKEVKLHRIKQLPKESNVSHTENKACDNYEICTLIDHITIHGKPAFCKHETSCIKSCKSFKPKTCKFTSKFPWVCNGCPNIKSCKLPKYYYYGDQAQKDYKEKLISSREGINLTEDKFKELDHIVTDSIRQGQPITHICETNSLGVSERTVYNYIKNGVLSAKKIEARRIVKYKPRYRKKMSKQEMKRIKENRSFTDYSTFVLEHPDLNVVQMDTVISSRDSSKVLLTLYFVSYKFQLAILLPNKEAQSVIDEFNHLCETLGLETFKTLFGVILTDNGVEFCNPEAIEIDPVSQAQRTHVFYCEPYKSCQKGACEKNHEFIRYILPKNTSFEDLTQDKVNLMMSHINSTVRGSIKCTPYELMEKAFGTDILDKLKIKKIEPQKVQLNPELLKK